MDDFSLNSSDKKSSAALVEGVDFYLEGAAMVFTAHYLLSRGYCCESGCRHCPYSDEPQEPLTKDSTKAPL